MTARPGPYRPAPARIGSAAGDCSEWCGTPRASYRPSAWTPPGPTPASGCGAWPVCWRTGCWSGPTQATTRCLDLDLAGLLAGLGRVEMPLGLGAQLVE